MEQALWKERTYFITLASNFKIPLVRHLIRILGGVPLPTDVQTTAEMFSEMGKALKKGACVQIYPEGILLPYCRGLRPFRRGAFYLAEENQVPVLPMVITFHSPTGIRRIYKRKPCLHLHILPPLWPDPALPKRQQIKDLQERCFYSMHKRSRNPAELPAVSRDLFIMPDLFPPANLPEYVFRL